MSGNIHLGSTMYHAATPAKITLATPTSSKQWGAPCMGGCVPLVRGRTAGCSARPGQCAYLGDAVHGVRGGEANAGLAGEAAAAAIRSCPDVDLSSSVLETVSPARRRSAAFYVTSGAKNLFLLGNALPLL